MARVSRSCGLLMSGCWSRGYVFSFGRSVCSWNRLRKMMLVHKPHSTPWGFRECFQRSQRHYLTANHISRLRGTPHSWGRPISGTGESRVGKRFWKIKGKTPFTSWHLTRIFEMLLVAAGRTCRIRYMCRIEVWRAQKFCGLRRKWLRRE